MGDIKQRNKKFTYKVRVIWNEEKKGFLCSLGKEMMEVATPPEFNGHEGIWTPEDLFVASVNACIETTFLHYAERNKFEFLKYESEAEGTLERIDNKFMFSQIKVMPKIVVASQDQIEKAKNLIELAEKNCLISNSIASKVTVFPQIEVA
jgi:peroxiredoxin-like protein